MQKIGVTKMNEQRGKALRFFGLLNGPQTMGRGWFFWTGFLIIITVAYIAPTHLGIKPYKVNEFLVSGFLAASLSLLWGYCGILSLGQAAFFGIGGYTFGILGINMYTAMYFAYQICIMLIKYVSSK